MGIPLKEGVRNHGGRWSDNRRPNPVLYKGENGVNGVIDNGSPYYNDNIGFFKGGVHFGFGFKIFRLIQSQHLRILFDDKKRISHRFEPAGIWAKGTDQ